MKWLLTIGLLLAFPIPALGVAINADIGLTPAKDQTILRSQVRYQRKSDDPTTQNRDERVWDPVIGIAYTRQTLDDEWDLNATYQLNTTSNKFEFGDVLKYTLAYQKRILPWKLPERGVYTQLNLVLEADGVWAQKNRSSGALVDNSGGNTIFLSPGLQAASSLAVVEVSVQLPIVQTLNGNQVEMDFVLVGSVRVTF